MKKIKGIIEIIIGIIIITILVFGSTYVYDNFLNSTTNKNIIDSMEVQHKHLKQFNTETTSNFDTVKFDLEELKLVLDTMNHKLDTIDAKLNIIYNEVKKENTPLFDEIMDVLK